MIEKWNVMRKNNLAFKSKFLVVVFFLIGVLFFMRSVEGFNLHSLKDTPFSLGYSSGYLIGKLFLVLAGLRMILFAVKLFREKEMQ